MLSKFLHVTKTDAMIDFVVTQGRLAHYCSSEQQMGEVLKAVCHCEEELDARWNVCPFTSCF